MTGFPRIALIILGVALTSAAAGASAAEKIVAPESARCQGRQREPGFAQSVADRDAAAFAEYLHPRAAFGVGNKPTVGRAAVLAEWKGIIDGSALKLEWYPDVVTVGGDRDTLYSAGPALSQNPQTGAYQRSRFNSVWQRGEDGARPVIFDDGSRREPADAVAVQVFRDGRRPDCRAA